MNKAPCPCCGFLTMPKPWSFEICEVFWSQDDGQNNEHADEYPK